MKRLEGKVAVVTQAGSNFGRAIADAYAREGAHLVLQDWPDRRDRLEENVKRARQAGAKASIPGRCWGRDGAVPRRSR